MVFVAKYPVHIGCEVPHTVGCDVENEQINLNICVVGQFPLVESRKYKTRKGT